MLTLQASRFPSQPSSADCLLFFLVVLLLIIIYQSPLTITIISWERANPGRAHPATRQPTSLMNAAAACALLRGALGDAGNCAGGFQLCVSPGNWLQGGAENKRGQRFWWAAVRNRVWLAAPLGAPACRGQVREGLCRELASPARCCKVCAASEGLCRRFFRRGAY